MGRKFNKISFLEEIDNKIKVCELYQEKDPDESAKKRVETLDKNPCSDGDYHTVITLKGSINMTSEKTEDLLKEQIANYIILNSTIAPKVFACGCIIKYDLKKGIVTIDKLYSKDELYNLLEKLVEHSFEKNAKILTFKPSLGSIFRSHLKYSCLKDDYDTYKETYNVLYYAIGRFQNIDLFLEDLKLINIEKEKLYKHTLPFQMVSYVNMTKLTSFEKNVNQELGPQILNEITSFNQKTTVENFSLNSQYVVDFGNYILNKLKELERSDDKVIENYLNRSESKKYKFGEVDIAYSLYKDFGGSETWPSYAHALKAYQSFKNLSSDSNFYKNAMNNHSYKANLSAQEQAAFLINNNNMNILKYAYDNSVTKKFEVETGCTTAKSYIENYFIDPPHFCVKAIEKTGNIDLTFNTNKSYELIVPVKVSDKSLTNFERGGDRFIFLTDKNTEMVKVKYIVQTNNIKEIERDEVILRGVTYKFSKNKQMAEGFINEISKSRRKYY